MMLFSTVQTSRAGEGGVVRPGIDNDRLALRRRAYPERGVVSPVSLMEGGGEIIVVVICISKTSMSSASISMAIRLL